MYAAKYVRHVDIDSVFIDDWKRLESSAIDDNAYMAAAFAIPAVRYLSKDSSVHIVAVYSMLAGNLCGLGLFTYCRGAVDFPLPHFIAYKSPHSYLTGLLLDSTNPVEVLAEMLTFIKRSRPWVFGIRFSDLNLTGAMGQVFRDVGHHQPFSWHEISAKARACLDISTGTEKISQNLSAKRRKNYRHALNKLHEINTVSWRLITSKDITPDNIEAFMQLEDKGWRKAASSSLLSKENHVRFFYEAVQQFIHDGKIFFTELWLGDRVIASTCNFIAGKSGFAFKIGWDTEYKEFSPGMINEMEFLKSENLDRLSVEHIDSGAEENSFINSYWADRKMLVKGILALNRPVALLCRLGGPTIRRAHTIARARRRHRKIR